MTDRRCRFSKLFISLFLNTFRNRGMTISRLIILELSWKKTDFGAASANSMVKSAKIMTLNIIAKQFDMIQ